MKPTTQCWHQRVNPVIIFESEIIVKPTAETAPVFSAGFAAGHNKSIKWITFKGFSRNHWESCSFYCWEDNWKPSEREGAGSCRSYLTLGSHLRPARPPPQAPSPVNNSQSLRNALRFINSFVSLCQPRCLFCRIPSQISARSFEAGLFCLLVPGCYAERWVRGDVVEHQVVDVDDVE